MKKRWIVIFAAVLFLSLLAPSVMAQEATQAEGGRIYDEAGLFTEDDRLSLQAQAAAFCEKYVMDIVIATTDHIAEKTIEEYAADFYAANDCGLGENADGILLLIYVSDTDSDAALYTKGSRMLAVMSQERRNQILSEMNEGFYAGLYASISQIFLERVEEFANSPIEETTSQGGSSAELVSPEPTGRHVSKETLIMAGLAALLIPGFYCRHVISKYKMTNKIRTYNPDVKSAFQLTEEQDLFISESVTQKRVK